MPTVKEKVYDHIETVARQTADHEGLAKIVARRAQADWSKGTAPHVQKMQAKGKAERHLDLQEVGELAREGAEATNAAFSDIPLEKFSVEEVQDLWDKLK